MKSFLDHCSSLIEEQNNISSYLNNLVVIDQKTRKDYADFVNNDNGGDWNLGAINFAKKYGRPIDDIFGENLRMKQFMKKAKLFNFDIFSNDDWNNFWLICQHCDDDRKFQQWALDLIEKKFGKSNKNYKYLCDRISCGIMGRQKYGTQDICERD